MRGMAKLLHRVSRLSLFAFSVLNLGIDLGEKLTERLRGCYRAFQGATLGKCDDIVRMILQADAVRGDLGAQ